MTNRDSVVVFDSSLIVNGTNSSNSVMVRLPVQDDSSNRSTSDITVSFISYDDDLFFPSDFRVEKVSNSI